MADPIEIITALQLQAYPGAGSPCLSDAEYYVELVNGLVTDAWANPVDPVPPSVRAIALEAAGRASRNPKALTSVTRSADDGSRTERMAEKATRAGVYLTADERAELGGGKPRRRRRYGTIRVGLGY